MRIGRFFLIAACAVSAALVAGCGTEHASSGGAQPVGLAAAVSHTQDQTARIAGTYSTGSQGMTISFTETGLFDFARDRGTLTMQSPVGLTEVFLPPTVYLKVPADAGDGNGLPKGKTWVALPTAIAGVSTLGGGLLGPLDGGSSPAGLLASLTAASSNVVRLGPGNVRGVPVTGFALTIDPAKAATTMPAADRSEAEAFLKSVDVTKIPVDVWVDGQNLVRREKVTLAMSKSSGAPAGTTITMTTDFYDFGVPVHVSAPPASQVAQESQAFKESGSSVVASGSGSSSGSGFGSAAAPPPAASGTLTPAQTSSAEQAVSAFWAALGSNDTDRVASTVLPSQRSCVQSNLGAGGEVPSITVSSLHITSARPAGNAAATVFFTVNAQAGFGGQTIPILPAGPGTTQWLAADQVGGRWYVNLNDSTALAFGGGCS